MTLSSSVLDAAQLLLEDRWDLEGDEVVVLPVQEEFKDVQLNGVWDDGTHEGLICIEDLWTCVSNGMYLG